MTKIDFDRDALDAVVVTGPTAVGKTDLCLDLARALGAEIICLDSRTLYRGMDIGTAKPAPDERAAVPHHLLDVADPGERFTAADFLDRAAECARDIRGRGALPLFAGGTCMYLNALLNGFSFADLDIEPEVRADLERRADVLGAPALHAELAAADPEAAARIHPNDRRRIVRALEVFLATGQTLTGRNRRAAAGDSRPANLRRLRVFGLCRPREILHQRINKRAELMYNKGLVAETRSLLARHPEAAPFLQGVIGYADALKVLSGDMSQSQAETQTAQATRSFARRQIIWFRRLRRISWLNRETVSANTAVSLIGSALNY